MPIRYEAPAPVANEATMSGLLSRLGNARSGGGGGGGGFGGGFGQIVQLRDPTAELENRKDVTAIEGAIRGNLAAQGFANAGALQQQAAALDAWQFEQKVTVEEAARMRAMQRSLALLNGPDGATYAPHEKFEIAMTLASDINMIGQRQERDYKREQLKLMTEQRTALAEQNRAQAEYINERTAIIKGNYEYSVDPDKLDLLRREMADEGRGPALTGNPASDLVAINQFEQSVRKEAERRGLGVKMIKKPDGTLEMAEDDRLRLQSQLKSQSGTSGSGPAGSVESGVEWVTKNLAEWSADFAKTNNRPPSVEERDAHLKEAVKTYRAIQEAVGSSQPEVVSKQFSKKVSAELLGGLEAEQQKLLGRTLDDKTKTRAMGVLRDIKRLVETYGPPEAVENPRIRDRLKRLQGEYEGLVAVPVAPMPRTAPAPAISPPTQAKLESLGVKFPAPPAAAEPTYGGVKQSELEALGVKFPNR